MRTVTVTGVAGVVGALLCAACDPGGPISEQGRYALTDHGLAVRIGFLDDRWRGEPVLVGERTCPTLDCLQEGCDELTPPDGGIAACVEQTVTGASRRRLRDLRRRRRGVVGGAPDRVRATAGRRLRA
jgi:hypothetical protein